MSGNAVAVRDYIFKPEDRLLLDANILLFLHGPSSPKDLRVKDYSRAYKRMLAANSQIYVDVLVVSEFVNRYARIKCGSNRNFKGFRQSKAFEPVAGAIADAMRRILKHCKRTRNGFEALQINPLLDEYAQGKSDFNDQVIASICKRERLKLVTDDSDFSGKGIRVLTANRNLLN